MERPAIPLDRRTVRESCDATVAVAGRYRRRSLGVRPLDDAPETCPNNHAGDPRASRRSVLLTRRLAIKFLGSRDRGTPEGENRREFSEIPS